MVKKVMHLKKGTNKKNKVFCIGFHKTGTSSLGVALEILGYQVTGPNGVNDPDIKKNVLPMAYALAEKFDAFQDNPWPLLFQELDLKYPDSKFILTLRDTNSWITSQIRHFGSTKTPMRQWIYGSGCPEGNEDTYVKRFEDHTRDVLNYFKNRPKDLLIMDLSKGDGWEKLCSFLQTNIPNVSFPHINKASNREKRNVSNIHNRIKNFVNFIRFFI